MSLTDAFKLLGASFSRDSKGKVAVHQAPLASACIRNAENFSRGGRRHGRVARSIPELVAMRRRSG